MTFTSSIPKEVFNLLDDTAKRLAMPKNKIIEKALRIYLDQLNRAEYVKSYKKYTNDKDILTLAEEGMEDYLKQLNG